MDLLSFIGVAIAFAAILGGNWLEGGHLETLANGPAMVIVLGGTVGAVLLQTPMQVFLRTMRMLGMVFMPPTHSLDTTVNKLVKWSKVARKDGLLGLEAVVKGESDLFVRKGMQLLVDGSEPDDIRHTWRSNWTVASDSTCRPARCSRRWAVIHRPSASSAR